MPTAVLAVRGLDELRKAIRQADTQQLVVALKTANKDAAQLVVDRAKPLAPVRTGAMQRTIRALGSQKVGRVVMGNNTKVKYANAVHWGRKVGWVGGGGPHNLSGLQATQRREIQGRLSSFSGKRGHYGPNPIRRNAFLWATAQRMQLQIAYEYEKSIDRLVVQGINAVKGD